MRPAALVLGLLALTAPAARADGNGPLPPAGAPVVAGPLTDGTVLVAFDRGTDLCVGIPRRRSSCGPPPTAGQLPSLEIGEQIFGAVTADVASVEVLASGGAQTVPAGPGAYQGRYAGGVHFFLAAAKGRFPPYRLRMRDAQGRTVFATDLGEAPAVTRAVEIARGHVSGSGWRTVVYQRTALAPTPLDRGRTERVTCVRVETGEPHEPDDGCSGGTRDPAGMSFSTTSHCGLTARVVTGLAGPAVGRIDALLGDGERRRVALHALPASFGDARRAFVVLAGPEAAVRALLVRSRGHTRRLPLGAAPAEAECDRGFNFGASFGVFGFTIPPPGRSAGPIVARDDGDDLCVGLGTIAPTDCVVPPTDPFRTRVERRHVAGQTAVLAVTPPEVAALRLHLDGGAPLTVPSADLPGYTGRYAGLVKAATVTVAGIRRVYSTDLLGADGHVILSVPGPDEPPLAHTPRVIARLPGGVTVSVLGDCVQVRAGAPTRDRAACGFTDIPASFVNVPCAARRSIVFTRLRRPATGLTVVSTAGAVRARRHGRLALAILAPHAALREVRLAGLARIRMHLPPAARQCGYTAFAATPSGSWKAGGGRSTAAGHARMMSDAM